MFFCSTVLSTASAYASISDAWRKSRYSLQSSTAAVISTDNKDFLPLLIFQPSIAVQSRCRPCRLHSLSSLPDNKYPRVSFPCVCRWYPCFQRMPLRPSRIPFPPPQKKHDTSAFTLSVSADAESEETALSLPSFSKRKLTPSYSIYKCVHLSHVISRVSVESLIFTPVLCFLPLSGLHFIINMRLAGPILL
jgi:hypothetical protein